MLVVVPLSISVLLWEEFITSVSVEPLPPCFSRDDASFHTFCGRRLALYFYGVLEASALRTWRPWRRPVEFVMSFLYDLEYFTSNNHPHIFFFNQYHSIFNLSASSSVEVPGLARHNRRRRSQGREK